MKNRFYILLALLLFVTVTLNAQDNRKPKVKDKSPKKTLFSADSIYWGGNLGLSAYNGTTFVDISPNVGYKFNKYISGGIQTIYTSITQRYGNYVYKYSFYGAGPFIRIKPIKFLFLQAEYDILSVPDAFSFNGNKRTIADVNLAGIGLRNEMSDRMCYYFLFMYEYLPTPNSPYTYGLGSPLVYRVGFNVNF